MLEMFCCPCLWISAFVTSRRTQSHGNGSRSVTITSQRHARRSGSANPLFTSTESGQHIAIPMGNEILSQRRPGGTRDGSTEQIRGKQYHLGSLIELACQGDRKTTQKHVDGLSVDGLSVDGLSVDGLSVDGQGAEVHNLYHLYAILSLAHQADNTTASRHYKEWSRLVSSEASTSRGRSDFYGLPTYDQAVALSHAANDIADVNILGDCRTEPYTGYTPPDHDTSVPMNITIPRYEELMGIANERGTLGMINNEELSVEKIWKMTGDKELAETQPNPFRPETSAILAV